MRYKLTKEVDGDVPNRVMAAAETLFAERGLDVSVRELTSLAKVSLPAINYYFGSKEGLSEALFNNLAERINQQRTRELEACLETARKSNTLPSLDDILDSFLRPYLDPELSQEGLLLARFILHYRLYPTPVSIRVTKQHFDPMAQKYIAALAIACPSVSRTDLYWRYLFMLNAIVLTLVDNREDNRLSQLSIGKADPTNKAALRQALLSFLKNGLAG